VIRVYYSEDKNRTCRNPRIEIGQSVSSFNFKIGGAGNRSRQQIRPTPGSRSRLMFRTWFPCWLPHWRLC